MQTSTGHGYRGRVRSGCRTCRARKVKCDEAWPVCNNCTRLGRDCAYNPRKGARPSLSESTAPSIPSEAPPGLISPPSSTTTSTSSIGLTASDHPATKHPYVASVDATVRLEHALQRSIPLPASPHEVEDVSTALLISRDIELTTTMDFLAAEGKILQLSSTTFVEAVECIGISSYDPVNWRIMKHYAVEVGGACSAVALGINAVSALHKAQTFNLSPSRALSLYDSARDSFRELLSEDAHDFGMVILAAFLLCLFELTYGYGKTSTLKEPWEPLLYKVRCWAQDPASHSNISIRLVAWLKILFGITLRGGGTGLISEVLYSSLPSYDRQLPAIQPLVEYHSDTVDHLYNLLSAPLFEFYLQLQLLSGDIAHLTHYHRSRTTSKDQEQVVEQITVIKTRLLTLWEDRCVFQRQGPADLRAQLAPKIAQQVIRLIGLCTAAYHAEIVEIDRVLGDPVSNRTDSRPSQRAIRDVISGEWAAYDESGKLDPGFLRPLFMYAIESMDEQQSQWAAERIEEIHNPIYRSDFFAAFARALSSAQLLKDRRVTSKYFCISYFGVPPPFL